MSASRAYRIGEVAAATGVTVETLRYYEREGLLSVPARSAHGARRYGEDVVGRIQFVKQAQAAGLTLRDIQTLVQSRQGTSRAGCQKIRAMLARRIEELGQRVHEAEAFRAVLLNYLEACDRALADATLLDCPTIGAIERGHVQPAPGTGR